MQFTIWHIVNKHIAAFYFLQSESDLQLKNEATHHFELLHLKLGRYLVTAKTTNNPTYTKCYLQFFLTGKYWGLSRCVMMGLPSVRLEKLSNLGPTFTQFLAFQGHLYPHGWVRQSSSLDGGSCLSPNLPGLELPSLTKAQAVISIEDTVTLSQRIPCNLLTAWHVLPFHPPDEILTHILPPLCLSTAQHVFLH